MLVRQHRLDGVMAVGTGQRRQPDPVVQFVLDDYCHRHPVHSERKHAETQAHAGLRHRQLACRSAWPASGLSRYGKSQQHAACKGSLAADRRR
jgi:hypothetical protein